MKTYGLMWAHKLKKKKNTEIKKAKIKSLEINAKKTREFKGGVI